MNALVADTRAHADRISMAMLTLCEGKPLIAACAAMAVALTASVRGVVTERNEFEAFVRGEFADWCMASFDGKANSEGGNAS